MTLKASSRVLIGALAVLAIAPAFASTTPAPSAMPTLAAAAPLATSTVNPDPMAQAFAATGIVKYGTYAAAGENPLLRQIGKPGEHQLALANSCSDPWYTFSGWNLVGCAIKYIWFKPDPGDIGNP